MYDAYSNFLEVEELNVLTSNSVVSELPEIFACRGRPLEVCTDGAAPFSAKQLNYFSVWYNFICTASSPGYLHSNDLVEEEA